MSAILIRGAGVAKKYLRLLPALAENSHFYLRPTSGDHPGEYLRYADVDNERIQPFFNQISTSNLPKVGGGNGEYRKVNPTVTSVRMGNRYWVLKGHGARKLPTTRRVAFRLPLRSRFARVEGIRFHVRDWKLA